MYWFPAKKSTETMWEFILICMCKKSHQCVKIWIPKPCIKLTWNFHLPDIQRILFNVSMIHTKVSQTVTDVCNVTYTKRWWIKKKKKSISYLSFFFLKFTLYESLNITALGWSYVSDVWYWYSNNKSDLKKTLKVTKVTNSCILTQVLHKSCINKAKTYL